MQIQKVFTPERSKYLVFTADYILPTVIITSIILALYLMLYSQLFKIDNISCKLDFEPCENMVLLAELDKLKGQNIFNFQTQGVASKLTSRGLHYQGGSICQKPLGSLKVDLHSVYPVVALKIKDLDTWIALDSKYRVIKELHINPNVPTVIVSGPLTVVLGKPVQDSLIIETLAMTDRLFKQLPSIKSVTLVDENRIDVELDSGKTAVLTPKKDEVIQLRSLQAILQEVTISKGVHTIDVLLPACAKIII